MNFVLVITFVLLNIQKVKWLFENKSQATFIPTSLKSDAPLWHTYWRYIIRKRRLNDLQCKKTQMTPLVFVETLSRLAILHVQWRHFGFKMRPWSWFNTKYFCIRSMLLIISNLAHQNAGPFQRAQNVSVDAPCVTTCNVITVSHNHIVKLCMYCMWIYTLHYPVHHFALSWFIHVVHDEET